MHPNTHTHNTCTHKLCLFYKLIKEESPAYLFQLIPENNTSYTTKSVQKSQIPFFKTKTHFSIQKISVSCSYNGVE